MNNKPYTNELESLEREPSPEGAGSGRDEEAEARFSGEFGAFLSARTEGNKNREVVKESSGTIFFTNIVERIDRFNQIEKTVIVEEKAEVESASLPNPVRNVVSEKTVKQTVAAIVMVGKSIFELLKDYVFFSGKEKKRDPKKIEEEAKKNRNDQSFFEALKRIGKSLSYESKQRDGAEQVNRKLGGNLSYQGYVTETLEVRVDVETLLNKKNSEMSENELRAKRARAIQAASGGKKVRGQMAQQEMNPEKGINAGQRNAYTQAG